MKAQSHRKTNSQSEIQTSEQNLLSTISSKLRTKKANRKSQKSQSKTSQKQQNIETSQTQTLKSNLLTGIRSDKTPDKNQYIPCKQLPFSSILSSVNLFPVTFYDTIVFEAKVRQIDDLQSKGTKEAIIDWIEENNRFFFGEEMNCQLLNYVGEEDFWNVTVRLMLEHVMIFSEAIGAGNQKFIDISSIGKDQKRELNRLTVYILLCQMFFGLIPPQYSQSRARCTFGYYMVKQKARQKPTKVKKQVSFTPGQQQNRQKLLSLLGYFTFMSNPQTLQHLKTQTIKIQTFTFPLKQRYLINPDKQKPQQTQKKNVWGCDEQFFGQIDSQELKCIEVEDKINSGQLIDFQDPELNVKVLAFYQIQGRIDEEVYMGDLRYRSLVLFMFEHPEVFVLKLLLNQIINPQMTVQITGLIKFSKCKFNGNAFELLAFQDVQSKKDPKNNHKLVLTKRLKEQHTIKTYSHDSVRNKFEKYKCALRILTRYMKDNQITINLAQVSHCDIYLTFFILWISVSSFPTKDCRFVFKVNDNEMKTRNLLKNLKKIKKQFEGKEIGQVFNVIRCYEKFVLEWNQKTEGKINEDSAMKSLYENQNPAKMTFFEYIKSYVF